VKKVYILIIILGAFSLFLSIAFAQENSKGPSQVSNDESDYSRLKASVSERRLEFKDRYLRAGSGSDRKRLIREAQEFLFNVLTEKVFPAWIGTKWSFNGTTRTPGEGSIACGTFVVYTLQDVGFKIPSKMARQPSENIIKNLIGKDKIKRFWNSASIEKVNRWIIESGEGIYIVGMDIHAGFIVNKNNNIYFIHSSYYAPPLSVVSQDLTEKSPLTDSRYRVLGKILDEEMVEKWIRGDSFPVIYDYFKH